MFFPSGKQLEPIESGNRGTHRVSPVVRSPGLMPQAHSSGLPRKNQPLMQVRSHRKGAVSEWRPGDQNATNLLWDSPNILGIRLIVYEMRCTIPALVQHAPAFATASCERGAGAFLCRASLSRWRGSLPLRHFNEILKLGNRFQHTLRPLSTHRPGSL